MTGTWLEVVDEIGSTSDALIERAMAGGGVQALLARRQLRGRGRRGRRWEAPAGNLAMSVLIRPDMATDEIGQVVFLSGLAMLEGLQAHVTDGRRLMLKWPNDVLLEGEKLAGVLVDTALSPMQRVEWMVIGFGANLATAPSLDRPSACLAMCADPLPEPESVAHDILARLDEWFATTRRDGFAAARSAWMGAAHRAGTPVLVEGREGRFAGLSEHGHLLMEVGGLVEIVSTGDVVLARS